MVQFLCDRVEDCFSFLCQCRCILETVDLDILGDYMFRLHPSWMFSMQCVAAAEPVLLL